MTTLSVDGSYMLHRSAFRLMRNMHDKYSSREDDNDPEYVKALINIMQPKSLIYAFMTSVGKQARDFEATKIYVFWDHGIPEHRFELYPAYKGSRIRGDDEVPGVLDLLRETSESILHSQLPNLGVISIGHESVEADDFAYIVSRVEESGIHISEDYDWTLNINQGWILHRPIADETCTLQDLATKYAVPESDVREINLWIKAMTGDDSDEVGGVYGIGASFALKFAKLLIRGKPLPDGVKGSSVTKQMDLVLRNRKIFDTAWASDKYTQYLIDEASKVKKLTEATLEDWMTFAETAGCESGSLSGYWPNWKKNTRPTPKP